MNFSAGVSSTASMTSPTTSIATEHVDKTISGSTEGGTESSGTTKSDRTTLPDHDNMHAGTVDTATNPEKGTTPTGGNIISCVNLGQIPYATNSNFFISRNIIYVIIYKTILNFNVTECSRTHPGLKKTSKKFSRVIYFFCFTY